MIQSDVFKFAVSFEALELGNCSTMSLTRNGFKYVLAHAIIKQFVVFLLRLQQFPMIHMCID